jgi:hypothetical protein
MGKAMAKLNEAHDTCMANEVVVDKRTWNLLKQLPNLGLTVASKRPHGAVRILAESFEGQQYQGEDIIVPEEYFNDRTWQANAVLSMARYIPNVVRERLAAGHDTWLAELRNPAVIFMNVPLDDMSVSKAVIEKVSHRRAAERLRTRCAHAARLTRLSLARPPAAARCRDRPPGHV